MAVALKSAVTGWEHTYSLAVSGESDADRASSTISGLKISLKRPPSTSQCPCTKWDHQAINLQDKLEVLWLFEAGEKLSRIRNVLGLSTSTMATIRDNKEKIRASSQVATLQAATKLMHSCSLVMENMEWKLSMWINDQNELNVPINIMLHPGEGLQPVRGPQVGAGRGCPIGDLRGSCGWFACFKACQSLHALGWVVRLGAARPWAQLLHLCADTLPCFRE